MNNIEQTAKNGEIIFLDTKYPLSFTYIHKPGFIMHGTRFSSLEHWSTFCRAKCFKEDYIAEQLKYSPDRSVLNSLKKRLENQTKNSNNKDYTSNWTTNRAEYMHDAIVCLINTSKEVQDFIKKTRYDHYAVTITNTFWGIGLTKLDVQKKLSSGMTAEDIYQEATTNKEDGAKTAKNKMGILWMDVRDAWFDQGLDKKIPYKKLKEPSKEVQKESTKETATTVNRFQFLTLSPENKDIE